VFTPVPSVLSVVKVVDFTEVPATSAVLPNVPGPFVTVAVIVQPLAQTFVPAAVVVSPREFFPLAKMYATAAGVTTPVEALLPLAATTAESLEVAN